MSVVANPAGKIVVKDIAAGLGRLPLHAVPNPSSPKLPSTI